MTEYVSINAAERGKTAYNGGKPRKPMNDARFVKAMYEEVAKSDAAPKAVKLHYIGEWKRGWDEARDEAEKPVKKKAKKKTKRKTKKK